MFYCFPPAVNRFFFQFRYFWIDLLLLSLILGRGCGSRVASRRGRARKWIKLPLLQWQIRGCMYDIYPFITAFASIFPPFSIIFAFNTTYSDIEIIVSIVMIISHQNTICWFHFEGQALASNFQECYWGGYFTIHLPNCFCRISSCLQWQMI